MHKTAPNLPLKIVIASRESALALWQANHIRDRLRALYPDSEISILGMTTQGDRIISTSLAKIGGKGLFVKELEEAMSSGAADIAVHSMKDVPMHLPSEFVLAAITQREDARDAFVSARYDKLESLPEGAKVGTSSLRRESQIRRCFPTLRVETLRGNVPTRLRKLDNGDYDAIILAAAGLKRLDLAHRITAFLSVEQSVPAVGQGALGIEGRAEREDLIELMSALNDSETALCVRAERAMSKALAGSCQVPLGAYAQMRNYQIYVKGMVASPDGRQLVEAELNGASHDPESLGLALANSLIEKGAQEILAQIESVQNT